MTPDPAPFATAWVAEWNARDLDQILTHYAQDVVFRSPVAARVVPDSDGVIRGKGALAAYWRAALPLAPNLHFTLEETFTTVGGLTILYANERGQRVAESLVFNDEGLVVFGMGAYGPE
jgi:ketosteroid isomerase-like protein